MTPLTLAGTGGELPLDYPQLLDALEAKPQPAVVFYGADDTRVELSGRVLGNWAVKLIGLFSEEYDVAEGQLVVVDVAPHWKAAAVVLAAGALGAEVVFGSATEPELVVTDRPGAWIVSDQLGSAELAALSAGMLDSSFAEATGEQLPAWVLDVSADVRQQPDQLLHQLPQVSLPQLDETSTSPLVLTSWAEDSVAKLLSVWAQGGLVVLFEGPASGARWEQMRRNEGVA